MAQRKIPAFQFYPKDWMAEPEIRCLTLAARGLWMDLLCLMHNSPRRGYLQSRDGKPLSLEQIARMTGCSTEEASLLLRELEIAGVYSVSEHGVIFSRRMVRDENKRQRCSDAGRKGGGNPALQERPLNGTFKGHPKGGDKGGVKGGVKGGPKPKGGSSSSTAIASSKTERSPPTPPPGGRRKGNAFVPEELELPPPLDTPGFRSVWREWCGWRRCEKRVPLTPTSARLQLEELAEIGPEAGEDAIRQAIKNGWQGLFPGKHKPADQFRGIREFVQESEREKGLFDD